MLQFFFYAWGKKIDPFTSFEMNTSHEHLKNVYWYPNCPFKLSDIYKYFHTYIK